MADKAGISLNHVPYDGATGALTALLGSEVDAAVVGTCEGYSYVDSGDLKCLGVFGRLPDEIFYRADFAVEQKFNNA